MFTKNRKINRRSLFVCFAILFFIPSCGLDEYYYLDPPDDSYHGNFEVSSDYLENYVAFRTKEDGVNSNYTSPDSPFKFLGTEIYYKIYNNYSTAYSHYSKVINYNSSEYSAAADYLIRTNGYKTFRLSSGYKTPLISPVGSNQYVYVRLTSYGNEDAFRRGICVGSSSKLSVYDDTYALRDNNGNAVSLRRSINSNYGFDFNTSDSNNPVPDRDDEDVYYSTTSTSDGTWYVAMYAVSVGRDSAFSTSYSKVLPLGILSITQNIQN